MITWWRTLADWTWRNPVTLKELRIGLRERRIFILQLLYLFLLLVFSLLLLPQLFEHKDSELLAQSGKEFFQVLFWLQLVLLIFTIPALTCGSLSGERERHSLDMVLASRLSSGELVAGKLGFAAYCLILLLFSALPLGSISFFLGGVSLGEALAAYLELFLFGMGAACIGLFSSARENRSNYSTVQSYLLILVGSFCLPFYAAMRLDNHRHVLPVGPAWYTFNQTVELGFFHFFVGASLYFITFLFLKARHRLRPQAVNLKAMAIGFLVFYAFCNGWMALLLSTVVNSSSDLDPLALITYMAHIGTLGFFLNPANLESQRESNIYQRSLFSKRFFWLILYVVGCSVPPMVHYGMGHPQNDYIYGYGYAVFFLLIYPINVWLFQQALLPRWQFAWVYYLGLMLMQFLPALGAFASDDQSAWTLYFVSPFMTLLRVMTPDSSDDQTLVFAVFLQLVLTLVLGLFYRIRLSRKKRG